MAAHVTYARTRRHRWAVLATLFLALGFATYTKTILLPVMLGLLSLLYFAEGHLGQRLITVIRRQWVGLLMYVAVSGGFLASYLLRLPPTTERGGSLYDLAVTTVLSTFGTTAVGGPWSVVPFGAGPAVEGHPPTYGVVVAWLLLLGGAFWIWARRERTLRALLLVGSYLGLSILLVYSGRGYVLNLIGGVRVGQSIQYIGDIAPILVLTLGLMMMSIRGATESSEPRRQPLIVGQPPRLAIACVAAALIAGATTSTVHLMKYWNSDYAERAFMESASAAIREQSPVLADTAVPESAAPLFTFPRNLIREQFAPLGSALRVARIGNDLSMFNSAAEVVPALVEGEPRTTADPSSPCPYRIQDEPVTISFTPVVNFGFWIGIDYRTNIAGTVQLNYGSREVSVPLENGTPHTLLVQSNDAFDSITLTPIPNQRICVSAVRVGALTDRRAS